jgi:hypothetical protein
MRSLTEIQALCEAARLPHLPGYEICGDGSIWSVAHNWRGYGRRQLVVTPNTHGYLCVRLTIGETRKSYMVHKLVAEAFHGTKPVGCEIRHLDGNKTNNRADNLAYGTKKDNAADRDAHGRTARGSQNGASKLDKASVITIKSLLAYGLSQRAIAREFGVHQTSIHRIASGEAWNHVATA